MLLNMKIARVKKNYTQIKLAEVTGISVPTIQRLEAGTADYTKTQYATLLNIASALDLTVEQLVQKEGD